MPEPEALKVYERRVAAKVSFSFFWVALSRKTKYWARIMCVCVCVCWCIANYCVCLSVQSILWTNFGAPYIPLPCPTPHSSWPRRIWNARHAAWTLSNNFPPFLPCLLFALSCSCLSSSWLLLLFKFFRFWFYCQLTKFLGRLPWTKAQSVGLSPVGSDGQSCSPTMFHDSCHRWALQSGRAETTHLICNGHVAVFRPKTDAKVQRKYPKSMPKVSRKYLARMGSKIAVPNSFRPGQS